MSSSMDLDVEKIKQGDERAVNALAWILMDYARSHWTGRYPSEAADAVGDALMELLRDPERLERFETSEQIFNLCWRMTRNAMVHQQHKNRQEAQRTERLSYHTEDLPDTMPDVPEVDAETRLQLEEAMASLPERERLVVEAFAYGGMSTSEIAESWGVSYATIHTLRRKAFRRLRQQLADPDTADAP